MHKRLKPIKGMEHLDRYVENREGKWKWDNDMKELSGFGGGYEQTCRNMLSAALNWFEKNPKSSPKFHGFKDVYGICIADNKDAESLRNAILKVDKGCSGAMYSCVVNTALWIHANGWDKFVIEIKKKKS